MQAEVCVEGASESVSATNTKMPKGDEGQFSHSGAKRKSDLGILKLCLFLTRLCLQTQCGNEFPVTTPFSNPAAIPKSHQQEQEVRTCAVAQQRLEMHLQEALSSYSLGLPLITSSLATEGGSKHDPVHGFC